MVDISGHAGYGPAGADIVCAAVSALGCALVECMLRVEAAGGAEAFQCKMAPGRISVDITLKPEALERAQGMIDAVCAGFGLLEEGYAEWVKVYAPQQSMH